MMFGVLRFGVERSEVRILCVRGFEVSCESGLGLFRSDAEFAVAG